MDTKKHQQYTGIDWRLVEKCTKSFCRGWDSNPRQKSQEKMARKLVDCSTDLATAHLLNSKGTKVLYKVGGVEGPLPVIT